MKKERVLTCVFSILILVISLAVMIADFVVPLNFWTHPILNFLFCVFVGYGLYFIVLGIAKKSAWYLFISDVTLGLAILYALLQYTAYLPWWISVIIVIVFMFILAFVSIMVAGYKSEDIAKNKSADYKNYEQRKAEKSMEEHVIEEIPQIKSFKE